jgi:hypothetical protein
VIGLTDNHFSRKSRFDLLHHPHEADGVGEVLQLRF